MDVNAEIFNYRNEKYIKLFGSKNSENKIKFTKNIMIKYAQQNKKVYIYAVIGLFLEFYVDIN